MAKFKFILVRAAVIDEHYEIEADSPEEALEMAYDGNLPDPFHTEFIDWRDDEYQIADTEVIEPLYRMVKDYRNPKYQLTEEEKDLIVKAGPVF
jgi:hypothetical protein